MSRLLKSADLALYKAKSEGRGTYRLFEDEMDAQLQARRAMETELHGAMDRHELVLFCQPLFDLAANRVAGFEAFLQWRHFGQPAQRLALAGPLSSGRTAIAVASPA